MNEEVHATHLHQSNDVEPMSPVKKQRGLTEEQKIHVRQLKLMNTKPLVMLNKLNAELNEDFKISKKKLNSYLSNLKRIVGNDGETLTGINTFVQANKYDANLPDSKLCPMVLSVIF